MPHLGSVEAQLPVGGTTGPGGTGRPCDLGNDKLKGSLLLLKTVLVPLSSGFTGAGRTVHCLETVAVATAGARRQQECLPAAPSGQSRVPGKAHTLLHYFSCASLPEGGTVAGRGLFCVGWPFTDLRVHRATRGAGGNAGITLPPAFHLPPASPPRF